MPITELVPIILAAGRGKRLGVDVPKPMVLVRDRPLMNDAVETLFKMGFGPGDTLAVIGHKSKAIEGYYSADLKYVLQENLNGNAGALDVALPHIENLEEKHILTIQGDDSPQATEENLRNLIHTHFSRSADVSVLTVNKPDDVVHKNEFVYDSEGRIIDVIPRVTTDSNGSYIAGIFMFSGKFLATYLPKLKQSTEQGKELGINPMIKLAVAGGRKVFHCYSNVPYIAVNTPLGLQRLRNN